MRKQLQVFERDLGGEGGQENLPGRGIIRHGI